MRKVLIVDDEKIIRKYNSGLMKARGYKTFEAKDGREASTLMTDENKMSLVVLDIKMDNGGGAVLVDVIKSKSPETKIVVSSVYPLDDQKRLIGNADAYHQKSEGQEMLMLRVESVLQKHLTS